MKRLLSGALALAFLIDMTGAASASYRNERYQYESDQRHRVHSEKRVKASDFRPGRTARARMQPARTLTRKERREAEAYQTAMTRAGRTASAIARH